ncbi:hypothetical protein BH20CHL7_BH20CHL7_02710 [soil metagenome]
MSIRVEAYLAAGVASGVADHAGHLRDVLEAGGDLVLTRAAWRATGTTGSEPVGTWSVPADEVLVAIGDDDPPMPVHASWRAIRLEMGPYAVEGELPTLPGYDPGRALVRPSGEFVLLRDVRMGWLRAVGSGLTPVGQVAVVNRYAVERVEADLMLGFYFPGATLGTTPHTDAGGGAGLPVLST